MTKFPERIPLPSEVFLQRETRRKQIIASVFRGVGLRLAIIIAEMIGFFYWNSSSLLLDALSGFVDIGTSLLFMLCVKLADKPPDRHHPFGHGRFEPAAGLQLGVFFVLIGGYLGVQQLFFTAHKNLILHISPYAWILPAVSVAVLEFAYQHMKKISLKQQSPALLADAAHYRIDALGCFFAALALLLGSFFPRYSFLLDQLGAILIALLMMFVGIKAVRENLSQILDRTPDPSFFDKVQKAARLVPEVKATEKLKIQLYGPDAHVSIDIEVDPFISVEKAHDITQRVRFEIQKSWPAVRDVIVHVEPYYDNDH
jgi:cation diffusion facilitator family transporter